VRQRDVARRQGAPGGPACGDGRDGRRRGARPRYRDANVAFHEALYAGAGNGYLAELADATRRRLAPFRAAQLGGADRLAASHAEHGAIIEAIQAGDGAAAAAAVRAHLAATEGAWGMMAGQPPVRLG
jgi:DNA-binding GntR family transcriptional regulator